MSLLTNARVLGYVFNPLSVFYCHRPDGELRCVVAEVHNTYGERHCYLLEPGERGRGRGRQGVLRLAVSDRRRPLPDVAAGAGRAAVGADGAAPGRRAGVRGLARPGRRLPLTNAAVARMLVRHPLMTGPGDVADPPAGGQALAARRRPRAAPAAPAAGARGMTVVAAMRGQTSDLAHAACRPGSPLRATDRAGALPAHRARAARPPLRASCPTAARGRRAEPGAPVMTIVRDAFFHRLAAAGKIGFGEAYMAGDWTADDLAGDDGGVRRPRRAAAAGAAAAPAARCTSRASRRSSATRSPARPATSPATTTSRTTSSPPSSTPP